MDQEPGTNGVVVPFPVGRNGTRASRRIGMPASEPVQSTLGPERRMSVVEIEIRGARSVEQRLGHDEARAAVELAVDHIASHLLSHGADEVALEGSSSRPVLIASFGANDHALRAVAAAVDARDAARAACPAGSAAPSGHGHGRDHDGLDAAVGVHTGSVVDLAVGGITPMPFRAVGTLHTFAARLAADAGFGQILLSADTLGHVTGAASVHAEGSVVLNGHGERREAFCLLGLAPAAGD
ncbi:MAG: hypothetical protein WEA10_10060 [Actinomycetota bacterium]